MVTVGLSVNVTLGLTDRSGVMAVRDNDKVLYDLDWDVVPVGERVTEISDVVESETEACCVGDGLREMDSDSVTETLTVRECVLSERVGVTAFVELTHRDDDAVGEYVADVELLLDLDSSGVSENVPL